MSDSEDEDYALYGTPLEPLDEESIPRKKPVNIEDQIVTDKHGKRRFHGAFTGGFSAGFFNSVGSLEGWKPSTFKSTRTNKAESLVQKPDDFMDDEDRDEFGIAPTVLRAKPEYGGSKKNKREIGQRFSVHPIPGEPVLQTILEPIRETVGVKLLMKMGWKPGQGIGPRLSMNEKKKAKVYGCARPPGEPVHSKEDSDENGSEGEGLPGSLDSTVLFAPDDYEPFLAQPKQDTFGMGYKGLDRRSILGGTGKDSQHFNLFEPPPIRDKKNKLSITGQAFGVGAFEEEDEDIYAKDDMSQYDFALESHATLAEKRKIERKKQKQLLAITEQSDILSGFVAAKNPKPRKKYFPPPELPPGFVPRPRRTRFDEAPKTMFRSMANVEIEHNKTQLTASDRKAIIGDSHHTTATKVKKSDTIETELNSENETANYTGSRFRPFAEDVDKQARYERYLSFVKIGAKDAFHNVQPKSMSDWEKEKERKEFEEAARLYTPLSGFMAEKFTPGQCKDDSDTVRDVENALSEQSDMVSAAKAMMFGKLTRLTLDWAPSSFLCKRFNISPPWTTTEMLPSAGVSKVKKKFKFSIFDFLEASKHNQLSDLAQNNVTSEVGSGEIMKEPIEDLTDIKIEDSSKDGRNHDMAKDLKENQISVQEKVVEFEDVADKKDLFRAIFLSSSDEESEDEKKLSEETDNRSKVATSVSQEQLGGSELPETVKTALRNTSPPKGIFANIDLDSLSMQKSNSYRKKEDTKDAVNPPDPPELDLLAYGPKLPSTMKPTSKPIVEYSFTTSHAEDEWVEKGKEKKSSHKHGKKHSKKHTKETKKDKHKEHKRKKKKRHKE